MRDAACDRRQYRYSCLRPSQLTFHEIAKPALLALTEGDMTWATPWPCARHVSRSSPIPNLLLRHRRLLRLISSTHQLHQPPSCPGGVRKSTGPNCAYWWWPVASWAQKSTTRALPRCAGSTAFGNLVGGPRFQPFPDLTVVNPLVPALRVRQAPRVDDLFQLAEGTVCSRWLALVLNGVDQLAVLQLDAVHRHVDLRHVDLVILAVAEIVVERLVGAVVADVAEDEPGASLLNDSDSVGTPPRQASAPRCPWRC